jgi:adenosylcobinamide-phosphate synthase
MPLPGLEYQVGARFILLACALVLEALFGGFELLFRVLPHPVAVLGGVITWCETRLNRPDRSPRTRTQRGLMTLVVLTAASAALGWGVAWVAGKARFGEGLELFAVVVLLAQRSLFEHVRAVATALNGDGLAAGRKAVGRIVGRDVASLDSHGVARAAIESLAENFSDAVVGPAFWYLLLGLPGIMAYKCVNTLDSMIGHTSERYRRFGAPTAYADTVLNLIPARFSALLIAAAATFVPRGRPLRALKLALRDAGKHRSKNAGWPEAAMAGAISVALAGPRVYGGEAVKDAWLGEEFTARAIPADIHRALAIYAIACLLLLGLVLLGVIGVLAI